MPAGGGQKRRRQQPQSVQLSLPPHHQHHQQHHHQQQSHFRREEAGSKTPSSQHHLQLPHHQHQQQQPARQLSLSMLIVLKRRLREVRARLQAQAAANAVLHGRRGGAGRGDNSYRTRPAAPAFASPGEPGQVLRHSLHFFLGESHYCQRASAKLIRMVAEDVKRRLKLALTGSRRFKLVVTAGLVQKARQGGLEASRCLLDAGCDGCATASLDRPTFVASAAAYWFYYE
ncbi:hypothetical protein BOX15_Mlig024344g1 [Macrostomum lignano]|uniref:Uncharacterized protein n=1 Tax=Macrostomum lignano TaxID=282301 RepID=A0A267FBQ0_9PLAT|nr:hypothetical protein BOX15_Mlig024344g1 [Macrostomum lignano]